MQVSPHQVSLTESHSSQGMEVRGKFFFLGEEKFWPKGVTYGPFRPNEREEPFPAEEVVRQDFAAMLSAGINTVRTYTPPPTWFLDLAHSNGLRVMVGLAWEQHVAFLDDSATKRGIQNRTRAAIRSCNRHPAILCYAVGNEIPATIVRWHGRRSVEKFIKTLYTIVKEEDPQALVTYVNYPTTEYLQLPFLDFCCFNVYLEAEETLKAYLARLQNLAWDKPLLIAEIGFDSKRNGETSQALQLECQVEAVFASGCAGSIVFAWTDEWYRGGAEIEDWDFGLTTRGRLPKPALDAVAAAYDRAPFSNGIDWPFISVIVCSYNGAGTIRETLNSLAVLDYSNHEVIVVDDGSSDQTAAIAGEFDFELIRTENRGLSNARNTGVQRARGDIIAYIDDDAGADPDWLRYLALMYLNSDYVAIGGLSPAPPGFGLVADCVASAPGRPVHVLLSDQEAEHIPGCNMSFKRSKLLELGGFDPCFTAAGDDVDICWRILEQGWRIGFQASALTWHRSRGSIRTYWAQQKGYGKAEALLEAKWPEKYNSAGHHNWQGRIYGAGLTDGFPIKRALIYQGKWGSAPFQSIYSPQSGAWSALTLVPEWFLVVALLTGLSLLGIKWPPLLWTIPLLLFAIAIPVTQAILCAKRAPLPMPGASRSRKILYRGVSAILHLVQPMARLAGRLQYGLTPWRKRAGNGAAIVGRCKRHFHIWSEHWHASSQWLGRLESLLRAEKLPLVCGGDFDPWDLEIRGGLFGRARLLMAAEEHDGGRQQLRFHVWSLFSVWAVALMGMFGILGFTALLDGFYMVAGLLLSLAVILFTRSRYEALTAVVSYSEAIKALDEQTRSSDPGRV